MLVTFLKVKTKRSVSLLPKRMIIANLKINYRVLPADTWCRSEVPLFSDAFHCFYSQEQLSSASHHCSRTTVHFEMKNVLIGHRGDTFQILSPDGNKNSTQLRAEGRAIQGVCLGSPESSSNSLSCRSTCEIWRRWSGEGAGLPSTRYSQALSTQHPVTFSQPACVPLVSQMSNAALTEAKLAHGHPF